MPVCYFNFNYAEIHRCDYVITDDGIEISVEYDIMNEVPSVNGMRVFGGNTKFDARDILIVDHHSKRNILVKQAYYAGHTRTYGTLDDGSNTKFLGHLYFEHNVLDQLTKLPVMPKIKTIKIYSTAILDWTGIPSLEVTDSSDYLNYRLSKNVTPSTIPINIQNIKQISVSDDWTLNGDGGSHISIDFLGCIEIELLKRINYDKIYDFIYELIIFLQLYCPDRFSVQKIHVMIDNVFYRCSVPLPETRIKGKHVQNTVRADLLSFLKKCYMNIPYRNSKSEIRNIPYIVLKTSRSLEDNFLMFYRFIECYYKKRESKNSCNFISSALSEHYAKCHHLAAEELEKFTQEIICLRNHYVHSGYYIKNSSLKISFGRKGENLRNYTVNNVDINWIYERTEILYQMVIDIIFVKLLNYSEYKFTRLF